MKKYFLIIWSIIFFCRMAVAYPSNPFGFVDRSGRLIIDLHKYREQQASIGQNSLSALELGDFHDGVALIVFWNGTRGFLDPKGQFLQQTANMIDDMHEGLARCEPKRGAGWGFINKNGKFVIPPKYKLVQRFSESVAACNTGSGWIYIDSSGRQRIEGVFQDAAPFSDGLANVRKQNIWGWIDHTGKFIPHAEFDTVYPTSCGISVGQSVESNLRGVGPNKYKLSYFDKNGKLLFVKRQSFALQNLFIAGASSNRLTNNGHFKQIEISYDPCFHENLAVAQEGSKFGFMDKTGKLIIAAKYDAAFPFHDGLAVVYSDGAGGKFGYVNKDGKEVVTPSLYTAGNFSEGLSVVSDSRDSGYHFIDRNGIRAMENDFEFAASFHEGKARVGRCSASPK